MSLTEFDNILRAVRSLLTCTAAPLIRIFRAFKKKQGFLLPHRKLGFSFPSCVQATTRTPP